MKLPLMQSKFTVKICEQQINWVIQHEATVNDRHKQTFSKVIAFLSTRNGGGSAALDRKSAMDVFGDANSFVWRHSSYETQTE